MADQIFQITFKPGILRDGSPFQGEYCTNGQWVRFFRGMPQNMGGMMAVPYVGNRELKELVANSLYVDSSTANYRDIFVGLNSPGVVIKSLCRFRVDNTGKVIQFKDSNINIGKSNVQIIPIVFQSGNDSKSSILCIPRMIDKITNNTAAGQIDNYTGQEFIQVESMTENAGVYPKLLAEITGGALFINPYLFIYGNNGLVRWSKSKYINNNLAKPFIFDLTKYSINISADKVIYGAAIRGGAANPSALFWTLGSVVRLINVGKLKANIIEDPDDIDFKKEVITNDSSILSSNCVVEYDGIFYWPGTGRFFIYNGVIIPLENNLNRQTFFDNVDMNKRQQVFGVKNIAKDEIWWFYPEIANAGNANIGCTRAVIFNIMDNSWYDTAIKRDCGYFDNVSGNMYTVGKQLSNPENDLDNYIWQHEVGQDQVNPNKHISTVPIKSSFTTPIISYATFNNFKQPAGIDKWMQIKRIEPNFVLTENANLTITINSQEYPSSKVIPSDNFTIDNNTKRIEGMFQGRNISFTISSNSLGSGYQMGINFVMADISDGR
jgi:hypothetical protein